MRIPRYRKHSTSDFGFVEWEGKRRRLPGAFNSPQSLAAYKAFVESLHATPIVSGSVTVEAVVMVFLDHAQTHYQSKFAWTEYHHCKANLRELLAFARKDPAASFGPRKLKAFRQRLIDKKLARSTINLAVARVKRAFRHAVAEELIPSSVWEALRSVRALEAGRSVANEPEPRKPVPWATVEATLPHMHPMLQDMVQAQWWIGCRSESLVLASPEQFSRLGDPVWHWSPRHKTEHRKRLVLPIGPKAQEHLRPYLQCTPYLFAPSVTARNPRYNEHYTPTTYMHAVTRAAARAGVPHWTPHQLRHARATAIRDKYGIEAAQASIGHENLSTTEIYAARSMSLAVRIALEFG